jgi:DNA-binding MarR family transcriptional regulator
MTREQGERLAEGIIRLRDEILRRREREHGHVDLSPTQAQALRTVVREGPLRIGALAEALGVTDATASRSVDALAALGLAAREPDPADARAVRVGATPRGRREQRLRRERFVRALERLMDELTEDEREQLESSLETLSALLVREAEPAGKG